ncbi:5'/3'-nucleotidase SurE [Candidatus Nucleicultrix amoebiphila]|jgi:5'-nucleotidase|uniref:5'-nucleotidase SurE n=1 Tax=Candidatus Nucleicultrix amoebiphila FS5 TaxID=1414854 RepID=A0A1W6N4A5_9PROT|nr:5'/3'-nucleotidase SurE [Candidatus Nucleicultrix amoebiphila]ARN84693.1 stationary phase survival protein SurE [Candidatus Nucleicultrix amoebiphila FS5]
MTKNVKPRILISNDDGINAHGIKVLEKIAHTFTDDVWVVAPEIEHSGAGHSLTLRRPIRARKVSSQRYAVDGTPTDCVMVALTKILKDNQPTLMLSGINHGINIGDDITYSGTVAAAMEATLLGVPSIAFSQAGKNDQPIKWSTAEHFATDIIKKLIANPWPPYVLINVNFPDVVSSSVKGIRVVKQGVRTVRENLLDWFDPNGQPFYWIGPRDSTPTEEGTDLEAIANGEISITPLHLDLTHEKTLRNLKQVF